MAELAPTHRSTTGWQRRPPAGRAPPLAHNARVSAGSSRWPPVPARSRLARFRRDVFALIGGAIVLFTVFLALAAPIIAPADPLKQNSKVRLSPIGTDGHPLGTDGNGRDMLSRLIYGSRTTLLVATVPVLVAAVFGLIMGSSPATSAAGSTPC